MRQPTIGGSRRHPVIEEATFKPSKIVIREPQNALPISPNADEPVKEEKRIYTEAEVMKLYHRHKGSCPLCGQKVSKGVTGHISKCLRLHNSSLASKTT